MLPWYNAYAWRLSPTTQRRSSSSLLHVRSPLNDTDNIVSLGEECDPVIQRSLLLVRQVVPLSLHVLRLGRGLSKGSGSVLSSEHWLPVSQVCLATIRNSRFEAGPGRKAILWSTQHASEYSQGKMGGRDAGVPLGYPPRMAGLLTVVSTTRLVCLVARHVVDFALKPAH